MALLVVPKKNHLTTSTNPYYVHTEWSDTVEPDKLVDIMASGRTTMTKPDIAGCLELLAEDMADLVADGKYVKTSLGAFYLCASGKLDAPDQAFTPGQADSSHALHLHFRANKSFEDRICSKAAVMRGKNVDRATPLIFSVFSVKSEMEMSAAAGDFLRIDGSRLKFDKASVDEGLFFVNGHETRSVQYATILPKTIIAQVPPELQSGSYVLSIRSRQGGKNLHEGRTAMPFIVE